ncbi:MAG TPA: bacillithiol biosynthesis cysteine-adding enzyme BshC [Flavobacteriales bacterium]|nr:bacillithiol biosynthesis cysteine-adding enzyme BshC [Flavobacteriales bacterium]HPH81999.1 bacillithiol biosynthesis cysteine-adding enzyme BshC [Flavobacteriales bacterium]
MKTRCSYVPYRKTGKFQPIVCDYLDQDPFLKPFYEAAPTLDNFQHFIHQKSQKTVDRVVLTEVLRDQYKQAGILDSIVEEQISKLLSEHTFTITTGQQTGILLGPLYSPLKIISAIKMSQELSNKYPQNQFVPIFWMATEDHDVAEIDHVWVEGQKLQWNSNQTGPVGRFSLDGMEEVLVQFDQIAGKSPDAVRLKEIFKNAYALPNLSLATRYIVHQLFGHWGLLVIDADDTRLKKAFAPIIIQDILEKNSFREVSQTKEKLEERYHSQVNGREINFFFLEDGYRERIVEEEGRFLTHDGKHSWNSEELKGLISEHPDKFSPNVLMRPLYQETILPNIAYFGGGAEISYWLELKGIFDHYRMPFPALMLRNSALIIDRRNTLRIEHARFQEEDLFKTRSELEKQIALSLSESDLELKNEFSDLTRLINQLKNHAQGFDTTLVSSAEALGKRLEDQLGRYSQKLIRAQKRASAIEINRLNEVFNHIYPGGTLQERKESISTFILRHSFLILDVIMDGCQPLEKSFLLIYQED